MVYLNFAVGATHGWGICGRYITRHLARLDSVRLETEPFDVRAVGNAIEFYELQKLLLREHEVARFPYRNGMWLADGPLLQGIGDERLLPRREPRIRGAVTVGYTFFENNLLQPAWVENGRKHYDRIAAGSSWCARVLRDSGLADVATVIQGIDPRVFHPADSNRAARDFLVDRFVVFSGGKFEYRKGQDVVIRAYKVLQDRHPDVMLVTAWLSPWPATMDSMRSSSLIRFQRSHDSPLAVVSEVLAENGIDLERVVIAPHQNNLAMAHLYHNTDVGVFPNRCEGGTNLVLMEYMACGKPVVAVNTTGHADIVNSSNALIISSNGQKIVERDGIAIASWPEPDLDDAIDKLEWAYQNRPAMSRLGQQGGKDLRQWTWARTADTFRQLIAQTVTSR